MSKSINELLRGLSIAGVKENAKADLYNPDIPAPDASMEIKDQYYNVFRFQSAPRNGTFALSNPRERLLNPRLEKWQLEGAIDPAAIRAATDPDTAPPSYSSGSLFSLTKESVQRPETSESLIKKSYNSSFNYANRFQPSGIQDTQEEGYSWQQGASDAFNFGKKLAKSDIINDIIKANLPVSGAAPASTRAAGSGGDARSDNIPQVVNPQWG